MHGKSDSKGGGNAPLSIDSGVIGGSTGGASEADLARGYTKPADEANTNKPDGIGLLYEGGSQGPEGFLDRPHGWER